MTRSCRADHGGDTGGLRRPGAPPGHDLRCAGAHWGLPGPILPNPANKAGCYAAAYEVEAERLYAALLGAAAGDPSWRCGLRAALRQLPRVAGEQPLLARGLLIKDHIAGGPALAKREEMLERLTRLLTGRSRHSPPPLTPFMVSAIEVSVYMALERQVAELRGGGGASGRRRLLRRGDGGRGACGGGRVGGLRVRRTRAAGPDWSGCEGSGTGPNSASTQHKDPEPRTGSATPNRLCLATPRQG